MDPKELFTLCMDNNMKNIFKDNKKELGKGEQTKSEIKK